MLIAQCSLWKTYIVDGGGEFPVFLQVLVVARVDGVLVDALPELEGEEGVLPPGDGLHPMIPYNSHTKFSNDST